MAVGWAVGQSFTQPVPTAFAVDRAATLPGGASKNQAQALAMMRMTGDLAMSVACISAGTMLETAGPCTSFSAMSVALAAVAATTARSTRALKLDKATGTRLPTGETIETLKKMPSKPTPKP